MSDNGMGVGAVMEGVEFAPDGSIRTARIPEHTLLRIGMNVLAVRSERWATLAMNFVLFGAACWWPDRWRLAAAGGFALVVVILLALRKER